MLRRECLRAVAVAWCIYLRISTAYPGGAPDLVCSSMFPSGHFTEAQTIVSPYRIITLKTTYKPGETLSLNVVGNDAFFIGLYLQARSVGCRVNGTRAIGVFTTGDSRLQTRHCFGLVHSAVTHTTSSRKDSVSLYWTAPVLSPGHVVFRATVLENHSTYWVGVESPPLIDLQSEDTLTCDKIIKKGSPLDVITQTSVPYNTTTHNTKSDINEVGTSQDMFSASSSAVNTLQYFIFTLTTSVHCVLLWENIIN